MKRKEKKRNQIEYSMQYDKIWVERYREKKYKIK